jgi:hypothetical protein
VLHAACCVLQLPLLVLLLPPRDVDACTSEGSDPYIAASRVRNFANCRARLAYCIRRTASEKVAAAKKTRQWLLCGETNDLLIIYLSDTWPNISPILPCGFCQQERNLGPHTSGLER